MLEFFVVPSSTTVLSNVSDIANPWFQGFLPFIYIAVGVFAAAVIAVWLRDSIIDAFYRITRLISQPPADVRQAQEARKRFREVYYRNHDDWGGSGGSYMGYGN